MRNSSTLLRGNPARHLGSMLLAGVVTLGLTACSGSSAPSGKQSTAPGGGDGGGILAGDDDVFHVVGPEGGPFPSGERAYWIRNTLSGRPLDWAASSNRPWLTFSENAGTLGPGDQQEVVVTLDGDYAATLPVGNYDADIVFRDENGQTEIFFAFLLTVVPAHADALLVVSPAENFRASGEVGGAIDPPRKSYTLENVGQEPLDWSVKTSTSWSFVDSPSSGQLAPFEQTDVLVSLASTANSLGAGEHNARIEFKNETSGLGDTVRRLRLDLESDGGGGDGRVTDGLQVLYTFEEGSGSVVHDVSGLVPALDLTVSNPAGTTSWGPGTLAFEAPTIARSGVAAQRVSKAIAATNEITVEAWIDPANLTQDGPARIATISGGTALRNVTLGQGLWSDKPSDTFNVRLRSTTTDKDGMPLVTTDAGSAKPGLQHLVYTRDPSGAARIYIDNVLTKTGSIAGSTANWDLSYEIALGNEIGAARPWLGTMHLVAVYDRALSAAEVALNFGAGTGDAQGAGMLAVTPESDFSTTAVAGQSVEDGHTRYTVSNVGGERLSWRASVDQPWLLIDGQSSGMLDPDEKMDVKVKLVAGLILSMSPGYYSAQVLVENTDTGFGTTERYVKLKITDPNGGGGGTADLEYFEKTAGALDYMGVMVKRTSSSQTVWAPGSPTQEYPGGWVTPGEYELSVNTPRVHGKLDGVHTGVKRPGDQIVGVVVNKPLEWEGWENHNYTNHPDFYLQNWGQVKTVDLKPGDVLHVAYGTFPVNFGTRQGSDGIVVYCVESEPQPRGGLWGLGMTGFDEDLWTLLEQRVQQSAWHVGYNDKSSYYWGPADGTLPQTLPSDLGQDPGNAKNQQARVLARWLANRAFKMMKEGPGSLNVEEFDRLFQFQCNNVQLWGQWGDGVGAMNHMAHGSHRYPPYFVSDALLPTVAAAIALGYDPSYEPFHRMLSHMAQRVDMTMSHSSCYTFQNGNGGGQTLADHKNDNDYTKWLWYDVKATDMTAKASHRMCVWGPCYWARVLLGYPQTWRQALTLSSVGPNAVNPDGSPGSWQGHEWDQRGAGPGWHHFYADLEIQGSQWLWFSGVANDSQFAQFSRRSMLFQEGYGKFWSEWVAARYIGEPLDPKGSKGGGKGRHSVTNKAKNAFVDVVRVVGE